MQRKRNWLISIILGVLFSIAITIGSKIDDFDFDNPIKSFLLGDYFFNIPVLAIIISVFLYIVYYFISDNKYVLESDITRTNKKTIKKFFIYQIIIFVCWIPYFLAFYPGILSPDSYSLVNQYLEITPLNNRHPILYTLIAMLFMKIGDLFRSVNFGVGLFSLFQMLVMSAIFSYSVLWLEKRTKNKWILIISMCFYALNPVIAMYSVTLWKDVMFGGIMLIFILSITDVVISKGKLFTSTKKSLLFAFVSLLVSLLRNNGIYVVIFTFIFIIIAYRKIIAKKTFLLLSVVLIFFVITGPIYNILGIAKGEFAESVGMPLQQISYSIKNGTNLTEEQEEVLSNILPLEKYANNYKPYTPDYIKFDEQFDNEYLDSHKIEFIKTWIEMFPRNAKSYVKAWLMQTVGYYNISSSNWVVYDDEAEAESGIHFYDLIEESTGIHAKDIIKNQFIDSNYNKLPLYNIAFSVYLLAIFFGTCIIRRQYKSMLIGLPLFGLWGTLMIAAPTWCEFRYMYSFHLALPVLVVLLLYKVNKDEENFFGHANTEAKVIKDSDKVIEIHTG